MDAALRFLSPFLLSTIFASLAAGQTVTPAAVDGAARDALKTWDAPGVALAIVKPDNILLVRGYGNRELGGKAPVTADTLFPLASCTKAFTSTALAILVDDGKITWDDPVRKHLPTFHLAEANADALVSIRDLVCHRTGVGGHEFLWYRAPWSQDESIRRIGRVQPSGPFRSTFAYQTIMFMAAGKAAGRYHQDGWAGLVRERIIEPLGMTNTVLSGAEAEKKSDRARGHRPDRDGKIGVCDEYPIREPNAAGSIYSTARDLATWLQFQLGDGSWRGRPIVSAENLAETHKPQAIIPMDATANALSPLSVQLSYAMGWVLQDYRGVPMLTHSGWIDGYRVQLTLLPGQKTGIAVLANLHGTRMNVALTNRLVDMILNAPEKDWNAYYLNLIKAEDGARAEARRERDRLRNPQSKPSLPLPAYEGDYEHPAYGVCHVKVKNGGLHWEWSTFQEALEPFRGDVFEIRNLILGDPLLLFRGDVRGVTGLKVLDVEFTKK